MEGEMQNDAASTSIEWSEFGLDEPLGTQRRGDSTIYFFDADLPDIPTLERMRAKGLNGAKWAVWNEDQDPQDLYDEMLGWLADGLSEYNALQGNLAPAFAEMGIYDDLTPRIGGEPQESVEGVGGFQSVVVVPPHIADSYEELFDPVIEQAQFAVVDAPAGKAAMVMACRGCENVLNLGALGHVLDACQRRYGMHLIGLGDGECPDIIVRFPNVGDQRQAILDTVGAMSDWYTLWEAEDGSLYMTLGWD